MSWVKLDDQFHAHPKVLRAGLAATGLFCRSLSYAACHATDGRIEREVAEMLSGGDLGLCDRLVDARLWDRDGDNFCIHDYLEYNPSQDELRTKREVERAQRQTAGRARAAQGARDGRGRFGSPVTTPATDQRAAGDSAGGSGGGCVTSLASGATSGPPAPSPSPPSASQTRAAAKITRSKKRRALPADLEASCPLDVVAWAKSDLGMDEWAVVYWHREFVGAVKAGKIKPAASVKGWLQSLRNSLGRQVGKRVPPRPTSAPRLDLAAELAEQEAAIERERRDGEAALRRGRP